MGACQRTKLDDLFQNNTTKNEIREDELMMKRERINRTHLILDDDPSSSALNNFSNHASKKCMIERELSMKHAVAPHENSDDPETITEFDVKWIGEKIDLEHAMKFEC